VHSSTKPSFVDEILHSLRAITRNLLATQPNTLTQCYKACAQARLRQTDNASIPDPASLFEKLDEHSFVPTPSFTETLSRARKLYGVGLGTSSLPLLTSIVQATVGLRWREVGDVADLLAVIDSDISQAIQVGFTPTVNRHTSVTEDNAEHQGRDSERSDTRYFSCSRSSRKA
jgi:hypothetical protein